MLTGDGSLSNDHYYQLLFPASLPALGLTQYHLWPSSQSCALSTLHTIHYTTHNS